MDKRFYVYFYLREDLTPYYVGKGTGRRAYSRNKHITKPPKDISLIFFVKENLSNDEAIYWEKYYIREYGRKDNNTGILRNFTDGGEGSIGYIHNEISKHKMRDLKTVNEYVIMSPSGEVYETNNLYDFCIKFNLSPSRMHYCQLGSIRHYKKWQCRNKVNMFDFLTIDELSVNLRAGNYFVSYKDGEPYLINNLSKFCRDNGLDISTLCKVLKGTYKQYKGWKIKKYENRNLDS